MGVMSCNRVGCDNIMCDTYVSGIGYICYECKEEFILRNTNKHENESEAINALHDFMYEMKSRYSASSSESFDVNKLFDE